MTSTIDLGEIRIEVTKKKIKNVHLSVNPPDANVRISAPQRMKLDTIRVFAISKLSWIKKQQKKLRAQERQKPLQYIERESHYLWGKRYLLGVSTDARPQRVVHDGHQMTIHVRKGAPLETRRAVMNAWYRDQMRNEMPQLLKKWEAIIGVHTSRFFVRRMKTRWGTCNIRARSIRLNTDLAKKPKECLEYIVVHELVHLLERRHNQRFHALMDQFMPQWKSCRDVLNQLPVPAYDREY